MSDPSHPRLIAGGGSFFAPLGTTIPLHPRGLRGDPLRHLRGRDERSEGPKSNSPPRQLAGRSLTWTKGKPLELEIGES